MKWIRTRSGALLNTRYITALLPMTVAEDGRQVPYWRAWISDKTATLTLGETLVPDHVVRALEAGEDPEP